jgi:hypothetical protein
MSSPLKSNPSFASILELTYLPPVNHFSFVCHSADAKVPLSHMSSTRQSPKVQTGAFTVHSTIVIVNILCWIELHRIATIIL